MINTIILHYYTTTPLHHYTTTQLYHVLNILLLQTPGIFTCPILLWLFADLGDVSFPVLQLILKLTGTVFCPMMCGKACQSIPWNDYAIGKGAVYYNKQVLEYVSQ